jgi:hypothetical protein
MAALVVAHGGDALLWSGWARCWVRNGEMRYENVIVLTPCSVEWRKQRRGLSTWHRQTAITHDGMGY